MRNRLTVDVQHKLIRVKLGPKRDEFRFDDALEKWRKGKDRRVYELKFKSSILRLPASIIVVCQGVKVTDEIKRFFYVCQYVLFIGFVQYSYTLIGVGLQLQVVELILLCMGLTDFRLCESQDSLVPDSRWISGWYSFDHWALRPHNIDLLSSQAFSCLPPRSAMSQVD